MLSFLIKCKNAIFDILFPPVCLNCQQALNNAGKYICKNCFNSIQLNSSLFCPVCRLRFAENKKICGHAGYVLAASGNYENQVLRNLIHCFKYEYFENLSSVLAEIMINYLNSLLDEKQQFIIGDSKLGIKNFIIVPLPLHRTREKKRGFNQSKILAQFVARHFNLELVDVLKRTKNTEPQAQCKNEERIKNVADCFQIKNSADAKTTDAEKIKNKNILLIDDVFTSGATMNEAVKILKQNHCRRIIALVLAKA